QLHPKTTALRAASPENKRGLESRACFRSSQRRTGWLAASVAWLLLGVSGSGCAPPPCRCPDPIASTLPKPLPVAAPPLDAVVGSVVQIKVKVDEQMSSGKLSESYEYGTGFFVDERGRILTSAHVLAGIVDARRISVLHGGRPLQARIVWTDRDCDLAVLSVDAGKIRPMRLAEAAPRLGERVFAVGFPYVDVFTDHLPAFSSGNLAGTGRSIDYEGRQVDALLLTDAFVADGCSGGPLLNEAGEVIGVLRFNLSRKGTWMGLSFAEPIGSYLSHKSGGAP
ncbi:MAG: serine protease, partial [Deltaproteobacteria bacterium]|nr:serine protease [Deltaproteobacteria bacterium]